MPRSGFERSFVITRLSRGTQVRRRLTRECRYILTAKPERNPQSNRAQDGRPEERVSEPGQAELRIEGAGDRQHQGQAQGKAEALGGLNQPRGQALLPMLRAGEARNREGRKSNARPERPEDRPGQDAEIAPSHGKRRKGGQPQGDKRRGNDEYPLQAQSVHEPRGSPSADEEEDRRRRKKRETRIQWRVAKDLLQVDGQYDERSGRGAHDQREDVRGQGRPTAHEGERHEGRLRAILD